MEHGHLNEFMKFNASIYKSAYKVWCGFSKWNAFMSSTVKSPVTKKRQPGGFQTELKNLGPLMVPSCYQAIRCRHALRKTTSLADMPSR